jgi:hypothetical protein
LMISSCSWFRSSFIFSLQKPRNIPLYRRANWENMKDDLNQLHEDIIKIKDQKSNVIGSTLCVLFDYVLWPVPAW